MYVKESLFCVIFNMLNKLREHAAKLNGGLL